MIHSTDTPKQFTAVAGHPRLWRRTGGMYYIRAKVPENLRNIIGKTEIRKSLRTSTLKTAIPLLKLESLEVDRQFELAGEEQTGRKANSQQLSPELLSWIASKYFVGLEQQRASLESEAKGWTYGERRDVADTHIDDLMAAHRNPIYDDGGTNDTRQLDDFLSRVIPDLKVDKESREYKQLSVMFLNALTESENRLIYNLQDQPSFRNEFPDLAAHSILPPLPTQQICLGKLLDEFMEYQIETKSINTPNSYRLPVRVLREVIGDSTPVSEIAKEQVKKVCELLKCTPFNVTQRYKKLTVETAIEAARRANDTRVISVMTVRNYFISINAIFNYAVDEGYMRHNPLKSRQIRGAFQLKKKKPKKALYTDEELQAIFDAPLYRGCIDDEWHYNHPGENIIRRGRFWVPILGLFHGLRSNEACQLYTQDVGVEEKSNILYLKVRVDLDDEVAAEDKSVKNLPSWREVPVHPELLKMGFGKYVMERRKDSTSARLFPELKISKAKNRYSHTFSKWFSRFITSACGHKPKATFHSFRHHFRAALTQAGVSIEYAETLGGWKGEGSSEYEYRHSTLGDLLEVLRKVQYPQLSLRHLYSDNNDT